MRSFPPVAAITCWIALLVSSGAPALAQAETAGEASPSDTQPTAVAAPAEAERESAKTPTAGLRDAGAEKSSREKPPRQALLASVTIFVLAIFVGFEVITKVPPTLHTPLMSGSNAISGITLVGAVIIAGAQLDVFSSLVGCLAVALATVNVVGGFLVTHRMLAMFKRK